MTTTHTWPPPKPSAIKNKCSDHWCHSDRSWPWQLALGPHDGCGGLASSTWAQIWPHPQTLRLNLFCFCLSFCFSLWGKSICSSRATIFVPFYNRDVFFYWESYSDEWNWFLMLGLFLHAFTCRRNRLNRSSQTNLFMLVCTFQRCRKSTELSNLALRKPLQ